MFRLVLDFFLVCILLAIVCLAGVTWYILPGLPDISTLSDTRLQVPLRIYSTQGSLLGEFGSKRRQPTTLEEIPEPLLQAVLAAEDDRFFEHLGVTWQGLVRATLNWIRTGKRTQGGSTITMQVARNFFLHREKTIKRKLDEIFLALKIEREINDKNKIMELYLNKIFFGQRAYGIAAAAEVYYGKKLEELTLAQSAMLAGLPQRPSTNNPIRNPRSAIIRRNYVLSRMQKLGYINQEQYQGAVREPVTARQHSPPLQVEAPYIAEMVRAELLDLYGEESFYDGYRVTTTIEDRLQTAANQAARTALLEYSRRHGFHGAEQHYKLVAETDWDHLLSQHATFGDQYPALVTRLGQRTAEIYLAGIGTLNIDWPGLAWARKYVDVDRRGSQPAQPSDVLRVGDVIRVQENEQGQWELSQLPRVQGSLVSLRPIDGATLALVGGFDFRLSKFNRATQTRRQPGSGFKPFLYSAALESGHTAASIINDAPVVYEGVGADGKDWRPQNYKGKSYGPTRLREALVHSRNLVSVRLLDLIGIHFFKAYLERFGFETAQMPNSLTLALGSNGLSPWELARGYSVFANGGYEVEPYFIQRIETNAGKTIYNARPLLACMDPQCLESESAQESTIGVGHRVIEELETVPEQRSRRVLSAQNAWLINSMTRDVIRRGTGVRARSLGRNDLSGKTGTTNDQRDAWFSGYNSGLVAVAWVGFDNFHPLGARETGARAALPMWAYYMEKALADEPESILPRPPGLMNVMINAESGQPAGNNNPNAINETFRMAYAPERQNGSTLSESTPGTEAADLQEQLF